MKTTEYFDQKLVERPEVQREWCERVIKNPIREEVQSDGLRFWGIIPECSNKALRVVTLEDRETMHNAFFDRNFLKKYQKEQG